MHPYVEHLRVEWQNVAFWIYVNHLHAGDLLRKGSLHLTVLDLRWVQDFLQEGRFFHTLVNADGRRGQQQDQSFHIGRIGNFLDCLSRGRRVKRRLLVLGQRAVDVLDHSTIVLAQRDAEAGSATLFVL